MSFIKCASRANWFILPIVWGFYYLIVGIQEIKLASESSRWPSVKGKIIFSNYSDHYARSAGSGNARGASSFSLDYEYEIDQKTFCGERVMFGYKNNFFTSDSYRRSKTYPKGSLVTVYYDPDNPEEAVLEPGINFPFSWNYILLAMILMLPLYFIIKHESIYKNEKKKDEI